MVTDELLAEGKGGYYCRKLYKGAQNYRATREENWCERHRGNGTGE
jgi:hypothetical protein